MNQSETETKKKLCSKCGKPITLDPSGSLTAWLFRRSECQCDTPGILPDPSTTDSPRLVEAPLSPNTDPHSVADPPSSAGGTGNPSSTSGTDSSSPNLQRPGSAGILPASTQAPPELVNDRYEILQLIGTGGMATVYRVADKSTGSIYVLKMISPQLARQESLAKRLEHEAHGVSKLSHAHICAVYDFGKDQSTDLPFLIMEYVAGQTLDQLLKTSGPLEEKRALEIFTQIAEALVFAHSKGVIHCDLKPSNILITKTLGKDDFVKIVDFGIAKIADSHNVDKTQASQTGDLLGSPLYMSPEQCRGEELDERSDIYSLGCAMYETLTGEPAFKAENPVKVILKQMSEEPRRLSPDLKISQSLQDCLFSCLEKNAEHRYANATELLADFERIRNGEAIKKKRRLHKLRIPSAFEISVIIGFAVIGLGLLVFLNGSLFNHKIMDWGLLENAARSTLFEGKYERAKEMFAENSEFPGASPQMKLTSLQELALVYHITGEPNKEGSLAVRIDPLRKQLQLTNDVNKAQIKRELQELSTYADMTSAAGSNSENEFAAVDILYNCYLLNKQGDSQYSLEILAEARDPIKKLYPKNQEFISALEYEYKIALENEVHRMEQDGNDSELKLATLLDKLAKYYGEKKEEFDESRYAQKAAKYVLEFTPASLNPQLRAKSAEILGNYALLLKRSGSKDWEHYKDLSEQYEQNK